MIASLSSRGRWPLSALALGLLLGLVPKNAWSDIDDELAKAGRQLELLEGKAGLIQHEYLHFEDKTLGGIRFESRLNDGQAMMLLKDYVGAAIVFYDLVQNEKNKSQPGYADAVFSLGEALFFNRNFIDARFYFMQLLDDPRGRPYRRVTLVRLMQIALRTKDFEKVDQIHSSLVKEASRVSPEAEYLWAKTLYQRGRHQEAAKSFSALKPGEPFFLQARYYLGVVFIRQGRYEDALNIYRAMGEQKPKTERDREVLELASLARGRLLHDMGKEVEALDAYQSIEHTSVHFDDALFEICWTYIKRSDGVEQSDERDKWLLEALRTLEILEVSTPDSTLVPRASLLKGHILEKMRKFDDAARAFMNVSHTYAAVKNELDQLITSHEDPVRYFNEVAGKDLDSFDLSSYLPPLAVKWMSSQVEMAGALGVMKDIETGRRYVTEARAQLKKLGALLKDNQDSVNLFPALREGAKRAIEVENARLILERNLARMEERIIMQQVSAGERRQIEEARRERERIEDLIDKLPTSQKDSEVRENRIRKQLEAMEKEVYASRIALKGMKAQLHAMEQWIRNNEEKLAGKEESVQDFREEIRRGWATANQLQNELDQLSNVLETEKSRAGLDSGTLSHEAGLRKQYTEALKKERELAEKIHSRLGPEGTTRVNKINDYRLRMAKLRRSVDKINHELREKVAVKAKKLQGQVDEEERQLSVFETALSKLEGESENLAGEVAFRALEDVRRKFYQLVLAADVGVLDVSWSRKHEQTRKITELSRKQAADQKRLRNEFKSVLEEVD